MHYKDQGNRTEIALKSDATITSADPSLLECQDHVYFHQQEAAFATL